MNKSTKRKPKSNDLDQFYTDPGVARTLIDRVISVVPLNNRKLFIEPSAGTGAFSNILVDLHHDIIAIDLDPKVVYAIKSNFLDILPGRLTDLKSSSVCIIGNPPFGKGANLAVRFFNHSCLFADTVAFIVPNTFKKASIHNKLDDNYHLIYQEDLPKNSFIYNKAQYNVPCVFQIWEKRKYKRTKITFEECKYFSFTSKDNADACIRRVGGRAGKIFTDFLNTSISSNYYIKVRAPYTVREIVEKVESVSFKSIVDQTAGVRSLSKGELTKAINKV